MSSAAFFCCCFFCYSRLFFGYFVDFSLILSIFLVLPMVFLLFSHVCLAPEDSGHSLGPHLLENPYERDSGDTLGTR